MIAFHGQMGMFTRALAYILSHGADGLRQVAEDAVLNANYVLRSLDDRSMRRRGRGPVHARGAVLGWLRQGFSTLDVAKGLIDEGFHPMTVYFPLVVHGAMLVEPTETESKAALDQFIAALRSVAERAKAGDPSLKTAPHFAPREPPRRNARRAQAGAGVEGTTARGSSGIEAVPECAASRPTSRQTA